MVPTTASEWQAYIRQLETNVRRQQTIMRQELYAGGSGLSFELALARGHDVSRHQTRRMYLSVESARRATGKLTRARRDFESWTNRTGRRYA